MKTLHAIQAEPTLLDFLKAAWPDWNPAYNPDGTISFWQGTARGNTIGGTEWLGTYRRWLKAGAPANAFDFAIDDDDGTDDEEDF